MKSVLISIQPKWVEKIASGKKTIEVRKTRPKIDTPFKCYIYCTKEKYKVDALHVFPNGRIEGWQLETANIFGEYCNERIIGEFVCDKIDKYKYRLTIYEETPYKGKYISKEKLAKTCLSIGEINDYLNGKNAYFWHITDLKIYDKPKELSEFYTEGDCDCMNCKTCYWFDKGNGYNVEDDCNLAYKSFNLHKSLKPIKRPPQSWCYVEVEE